MEGSSLFRVVDASALETKVLAKAERLAQRAAIPRFSRDHLGFCSSSLGSFCLTTDPMILSMAAVAARREGRDLREASVGNLAVRDRVSAVVNK